MLDSVVRRLKPERMVGHVFRHYKGAYYRVLQIGKHTETSEALVIYHGKNPSEIWVRPLTMFNDFVGDGIRRFWWCGPYHNHAAYFYQK